MKYTKRAFVIIVALSLAFTLALPAMAAVNWDDFRIVTEPKDLTVPHGESFTLSVGVNVPDGADEVTYQWCSRVGQPIPGAAASTLQLSPGDAYYPEAFQVSDFVCEITANESGGESKTLWTRHAAVKVEASFQEKLYSITLEPFEYTSDMVRSLWDDNGNGMGSWTFNGIVLMSFPLMLIDRFFMNFMALFSF